MKIEIQEPLQRTYDTMSGNAVEADVQTVPLFDEKLLLYNPREAWKKLSSHWNLAYKRSKDALTGHQLHSGIRNMANRVIAKELETIERESALKANDVRILIENDIFPTNSHELMEEIGNYRRNANFQLKKCQEMLEPEKRKRFSRNSGEFLNAVFNRRVFAGAYLERFNVDTMNSLLELTGGIPQVPVESGQVYSS